MVLPKSKCWIIIGNAGHGSGDSSQAKFILIFISLANLCTKPHKMFLELFAKRRRETVEEKIFLMKKKKKKCSNKSR